MDQKRFDQLAVALSRAAHRRSLLAVLSGALVSAGLLAAPEAESKGKGKKGKGQPQGHGTGKANAAKRRKQRDQRKTKRHKATAQACPLCKRLNAQGRCVVDHRVNGQCCTRAGGQRGTCLNGTCWPGNCSGPICTDQTCPDGCCDAAAQCHVNDADACGTGGESCASCDVAGEVCQGGDCVCQSGVICSVSGCCPNATDVCNDDDECCSKKTCADLPGQCGTLDDGCDGTITCGSPCGSACCDAATQACYQGVCAIRCSAGCPPQATACLQGVGGVDVCACAFEGTCPCSTGGGDTCPQGAICAVNTCANGGGCYNLCTPPPTCPAGRVALSNGTCALPCTVSVQCTDIGCEGCVGTATGDYCRNSGPLDGCTTDDSCPPGQFCSTEAGIFVCVAAC